MKKIRVAVIQLNSNDKVSSNLAQIERFVLAAVRDGAKLIVTPEYSDIRGDVECLQNNATTIPGAVSEFIAWLAKSNQCWIILGSMHERISGISRLGNTCLCFSPQGEIVAKYRKIHLYDALVNGFHYKESDNFYPGDSLQIVKIQDFKLGLSICYDLRFAELFRSLRANGANILVCSAAFNIYTGRDHWEILLRARAIENQCYVLAAGQIGGKGQEIPCLGRSMIIDPWGTVLACMTDKPGYIYADLDLDHINALRETLPVHTHRRGDVYCAYE